MAKEKISFIDRCQAEEERINRLISTLITATLTGLAVGVVILMQNKEDKDE